MASLNTLRTKGGLFISIVIGIALLGFLVGDFVPRGCSDQSVGVINGTKIDYPEYAGDVERYTTIMQSMTGKEALSSDESDQVRDMAWQSLIVKNAYRPGFEKMGIYPTDEEQADMGSGTYTSPVILSMFSDPQTGLFNPAILQQFWSSVESDASGRRAILWSYIKEQMNLERVMTKYTKLVSKGMYQTDLQVEAGVSAANNSYDVRLVQSNYSSIADSLINITATDMKAYYKDNIRKFKQTPSREVEYVEFDLMPSQDDMDHAQKEVEEMAAEFAQSEHPMQYATLNSQVSVNSQYQSLSQIDAEIAGVVVGKPEAMYGPVLKGYTYTIAREGGSKMMPDSVGVKIIVLQPTQKDLADSLVRVIKRGTNFAEMARQFSQDQTAATSGGDIGTLPLGQFPAEFTEDLIKSNRGDVYTIASPYALHVVQTTHKTPMVRKVQIATIKYQIDPSSLTEQEVYAKASDFLANAAGSYDNFKKATNEAALSQRVARVSSTDRNVNGLNESRELIRWIFNGKKGDVSGIMSIDGNYVVATISEVNNDEVASLESVSDAVRMELVKQKKAEMLIKQLTPGETVDQLAARTETDVQEVQGISMGDYSVEMVGVEQQLIGAIWATKEVNKTSKPVVGNSGVYLFEVTNIVVGEGATAESERVKLGAMAESYIAERVAAAMQDKSKIVDSRVKFF